MLREGSASTWMYGCSFWKPFSERFARRQIIWIIGRFLPCRQSISRPNQISTSVLSGVPLLPKKKKKGRASRNKVISASYASFLQAYPRHSHFISSLWITNGYVPLILEILDQKKPLQLLNRGLLNRQCPAQILLAGFQKGPGPAMQPSIRWRIQMRFQSSDAVSREIKRMTERAWNWPRLQCRRNRLAITVMTMEYTQLPLIKLTNLRVYRGRHRSLWQDGTLT